MASRRFYQLIKLTNVSSRVFVAADVRRLISRLLRCDGDQERCGLRAFGTKVQCSNFTFGFRVFPGHLEQTQGSAIRRRRLVPPSPGDRRISRRRRDGPPIAHVSAKHDMDPVARSVLPNALSSLHNRSLGEDSGETFYLSKAEPESVTGNWKEFLERISDAGRRLHPLRRRAIRARICGERGGKACRHLGSRAKHRATAPAARASPQF